MCTLFLFPLALTILCNAEEMPPWVNEFGPGAEEFWQQASELGLKDDTLHDLMRSVYWGVHGSNQRLKECRESWRAEGVDLFSFLREIIEDDVLPLGANVGHEVISQVRVLGTLAMADDVDVTEWVSSQTRKRLTEKLAGSIQSRNDVCYVVELLWVLGKTKREDAFNLLLEVQSKTFWNGKDAPEVDVAPETTDAISKRMNAYSVREIRTAALRVISESGTERAIEILATGKNISPDLHGLLDECFRTAVRRHVGIYDRIPSGRFGNELPEEKLAEIQRIYAQYGKTYEPIHEDRRLQEEWLNPSVVHPP